MRPCYHYTPASNWLSDPNGLVYHAGVWHMFYQYNPHGESWGHMAWGHATSPDLATWTEQPPALLEDDRHMIFSGSAVVDTAGAAGFGAGAVVAAYTGAVMGDGQHQAQCLAYSDDGCVSWQKYAGNPVLDLGMADFRDPNLFWHAPTARWIMVVALSHEDCAHLYASANLRDWTHLSTIGAFGPAVHIWECPALIELPVEGGGSRWLFKVDRLCAADGTGAVALTGTFDGSHFVPDCAPDGGPQWLSIDDGRDFYAAIPWHAPRDAAGRPVWIGWIGNHGYQGALPAKGWRGAMSLPKRIALRQTAAGWRLVQTVEPALAQRFTETAQASGRSINLTASTAARITCAGRDGDAASFVHSITAANGARLTLEAAGGQLTIDRADGTHAAYDQRITAPLSLTGGWTLWCDAGSIEVASACNGHWLTVQHGLGGATCDHQIIADVPIEAVVATLVE